MRGLLLLLTAFAAGGEEIVWEAKPLFRDFGGMVVANGVVLTGNITGETFRLSAFDLKSGKVLWNSEGRKYGSRIDCGRSTQRLARNCGDSHQSPRHGRAWESA